MSVRPRVYLAGPDVFLRDSRAVFERLRAACDALGMTGVEPSDGDLEIDFAGSDDERAQSICDGNLRLIREADGVIANLAPFRGHEPDPGTVFEVGYAVALGKPVVAYGVPPESYAARIGAALACRTDAVGQLREVATDTLVEGLGQRMNLMLTRSAVIEPSADAALNRLAALLGSGPAGTPPSLDVLAARVGAALKARGETVAVVESSAGGLASAALLAVPGASRFFKGGAVVYSRRAGRALMGLTAEDMTGMRGESEPYVGFMAQRMRDSHRATWGLCESGAAGPLPSPYGDAPGRVCLAVAGPRTDAVDVSLRTLETGSTGRSANMTRFAHELLTLFEQRLQDRA